MKDGWAPFYWYSVYPSAVEWAWPILSYRQTLLSRGRDTQEVWLTEAILTEIGHALSSINRKAAVAFVYQSYRLSNVTVVPIDTLLFHKGLDLCHSRLDRTWGLTDYLSFVVMKQEAFTMALTADQHFIQAGYRALMLESNNLLWSWKG